MSAYDKIARLYDPWSRSVVEDVPFYVDEAVRSGGPVLELGVGTGRIAVPIGAAGVRVVGVDLSAGMLEVARDSAALVPLVHPVTIAAVSDKLHGEGVTPNSKGFTPLDRLAGYLYTHITKTP